MKATKTLAAAALLAAGTQANAAITDFTISLEAELKASGAIITTGTGIGQYDDVSGIFTMTSLTEFTEGAAVNPGTLAGFDGHRNYERYDKHKRPEWNLPSNELCRHGRLCLLRQRSAEPIERRQRNRPDRWRKWHRRVVIDRDSGWHRHDHR